MRKLYKENEANYPRLCTDKLFADYENEYKFDGWFEKAIKFTENNQLLRADLWERFVMQFRQDADYEAGWRGEYWGKMMRGACFVYSYSKNEKLYDVLTKTINDMLDSQDEFGRISSYGINHEFDGWDIWARKYVLLGMQYYMEICSDESLKSKITDSMRAQVDYIMKKIGPAEENKIPITKATRHWRGLNSSSLLEPVVRLFNITGKKKYFDFAKYIVDCGGCDVKNIFTLAYEDEFYPYQYPVTKAYEMTSCFEGLLEFYRVTKEEKYLTAVMNFANKILESDFTVIGCSGCTHELFDHSTVRQANTTNGVIMQETCVTVTLMKFFYQLLLISGNSKYADAFEISLYNAYLGSLNTENVIEPTMLEKKDEVAIEALPFDSYSPLTSGTRGNGIGGLKVMSDNHYYGCCACIGSAGIGLAAKASNLISDLGFVINLYANGSVKSKTPLGEEITFTMETRYPADGKIKITADCLSENFEIALRIPSWSKKTAVKINGENTNVTEGYTKISRTWTKGDTIEIEFDMRTRLIRPIPYGSQILMNEVIWGANYMVPTFDKEDEKAKFHAALIRGPIVLAEDIRLGTDPDTAVGIKIDSNGYADVTIPEKDTAPYEHLIEVNVSLKNGEKLPLTDYASAGKLWNEKSKMAAWILTDDCQ